MFNRFLLLGALAAATLAAQTETPIESDRYQGPTIISRDSSLIGERSGKLLDYRFFASLMGTFDTNLTPYATNSNGSIAGTGGTSGLSAAFGVFGSRKWRRDELSVNYTGSYVDYFNSSNSIRTGSGLSQFLSLRYAHVLSKRWILDLTETAGTTGVANGAYTYTPLTASNVYIVPTNELFDTRTSFLQSRAQLLFQKSARLSFAVTGDYFLTHRAISALASLQGYRVGGDVSYRMSPRQTGSLFYSHSYFDFSRQFGNSNVDSIGVGYSYALNRRTQISAQVGVARANTVGVGTVKLDPQIAQIIGLPSIQSVFDRTIVAPIFSLELSRAFRNSSLGLLYSQGISPGNGVYLTSQQRTIDAHYSYAGFRRNSFSASAGYTSMSSVGIVIGDYRGFLTSLGWTYRLLGTSTFAIARYDYRHYIAGNQGLFRKDSNRFSVGVTYSPGQRSLALW